VRIIIHHFFSKVGARNTQLSVVFLIAFITAFRMLLSNILNAEFTIPLSINKISFYAFFSLIKMTETHI